MRARSESPRPREQSIGARGACGRRRRPGTPPPFARDALAALLSLAALGITGGPAGAAPQPVGPAAADAPSLLLVTIDTLRPDRLGCYGSESVETPNLDALAAGGMLFESVTTSAPITAPSHATMMTALSPRAHGVSANGQKLSPGVATLAGELRKAGYATGAFVSSAVLARRVGLDRGFDAYVAAYESATPRKEACVAESTNALAIPWLRAHAGGPFFLWVHYYDPHQPYRPPGPLGARVGPPPAGASPEHDPDGAGDTAPSADEARRQREGYEAEVAYVDAQLGALLAALDASGARGRTLVCVTSDHGETLGEHAGYFGHSHHLYDTTLLVPLVVSLPGRVPAGRIADEPGRLLDLAPTLLALLGRPGLETLEGRSMLPVAAAAGPAPGGRGAACSVSETRRAERGAAPMNVVPGKLSIRCPEGKLIRWLDSDSLEVFDLVMDPGETRNLAAHGGTPRGGDDRDALWARLAERLASWENRMGMGPALEPLDEETRERLRSLGYIE